MLAITLLPHLFNIVAMLLDLFVVVMLDEPSPCIQYVSMGPIVTLTRTMVT